MKNFPQQRGKEKSSWALAYLFINIVKNSWHSSSVTNVFSFLSSDGTLACLIYINTEKHPKNIPATLWELKIHALFIYQRRTQPIGCHSERVLWFMKFLGRSKGFIHKSTDISMQHHKHFWRTFNLLNVIIEFSDIFIKRTSFEDKKSHIKIQLLNFFQDWELKNFRGMLGHTRAFTDMHEHFLYEHTRTNWSS